jgi:hypothetical protein
MECACANAQDFPALTPGKYVNRLQALGGLLTSRLEAEARQTRADRLDLVFGDVELRLGPLTFTQVRR